MEEILVRNKYGMEEDCVYCTRKNHIQIHTMP